MIKWRIYYDNGKCYSGMDYPFNADSLGVICVLDWHDGQWHIHERDDYFVWKFTEDGWTGANYYGLFDYLQSPGEKKVLFGRTVTNDLFDKIKGRALRDMYDQS